MKPKPKGCRRLETRENEDIISLLPRDLFHHILSFVPTKYAVWTCMLSKPWQDLWMSTANLDFFYSCYEQQHNDDFIRFVNHVLRFHSSTIVRFRLHYWHTAPDVNLIVSWITAAVERRVQELYLEFPKHRVLSLPPCLCTSTFLTVLKVNSHSDFHLPSMICLSNLKNLSLTLVKFTSDSSVSRLFSNLRVLEKLKLKDCGWDNLRNVTISLSALTSFKIKISRCRFNCSIKVTAENLRYLNCDSDLTADLVLDNMPLLTHASIKLEHINKVRSRAAYHAANLFGGFGFAKSLELAKGSLECLYACNSVEKINIFPKFVNLIALEVDSQVTSNKTGRIVMDILRNSPVLETFVVWKMCVGKLNRQLCPRCVEFSLKECSVLCFTGNSADIAFVKYILKNARALERLKLYWKEVSYDQQQDLQDVTNTLKMLSDVSNSCVIEILEPR